MDTDQTQLETTESTTQHKLDEVKQMLNPWNTLPPLTIDYNSINTDTLSITGGGIGAVGSPLGATSGSVSVPTWTTTTNGTGGYSWQTLSTVPDTITHSNNITITGEGADIVMQGKSLRSWMESVEQRLNILTVNPALEQEWDELRELGERYRELEKKCKEKSKMWQQLKKMPAPRPPEP